LAITQWEGKLKGKTTVWVKNFKTIWSTLDKTFFFKFFKLKRGQKKKNRFVNFQGVLPQNFLETSVFFSIGWVYQF
jgi:hypothetical protein